jgi:hypothetical protein
MKVKILHDKPHPRHPLTPASQLVASRQILSHLEHEFKV